MKCFYGNASQQITRGCSDSAFDQKIKVVPNAQTCSNLFIYKGFNLTYESATAFRGSVVCQSNVGFTAGTPFSFRFGGSGSWLDNLPFTTTSLDYILHGSYLSSTQTRDFGSGSNLVECRVKAGNGYVTSDACKKTVCVGNTCSTPKTFVVTNSTNTVCTRSDTLEYTIGCAALDESAKAVCRQKFENIYIRPNGR